MNLPLALISASATKASKLLSRTMNFRPQVSRSFQDGNDLSRSPILKEISTDWTFSRSR